MIDDVQVPDSVLLVEAVERELTYLEKAERNEHFIVKHILAIEGDVGSRLKSVDIECQRWPGRSIADHVALQRSRTISASWKLGQRPNTAVSCWAPRMSVVTSWSADSQSPRRDSAWSCFQKPTNRPTTAPYSSAFRNDFPSAMPQPPVSVNPNGQVTCTIVQNASAEAALAPISPMPTKIQNVGMTKPTTAAPITKGLTLRIPPKLGSTLVST
jgi:hypothetical protein